MAQGEPLVSVIIPTHNRAALLPRAVESVLAQTYANLECIVVDDGSLDRTAQVVRGMADPRVEYLRHEASRGASAARNTGIAHSHGELIAFLDDDDEWLPAKLAKQVQMIDDSPASVGLVYCWMDYFDPEGCLVREHHPSFRGWIFPRVLGRHHIGNSSTLLLRREVVAGLGGFDEQLPRGNDGDFVVRVCHQYEVDVVPEVLVRAHTDHGYDQIGRQDPVGMRNAIKGHQAVLSKFQNELPRYPSQAAHRYATMAYYYGRLGEWGSCLASYRSALRVSPWSGAVYLNLLRMLTDRVAGRHQARHHVG